jgi:hypothetical protein
VGPFDLAAVLGYAQRKESLTDWGPGISNIRWVCCWMTTQPQT